jgi:hypothetical protein
VSEDARPGTLTHEQVWDLIPWLVNARLSAEEAVGVRAHLERCAPCAREYAEQRRIFDGMQADDSIAFASEAAFQKLAARIDAPPSGERAAMATRWVAAAGLAAMLGLAVWGGGWLLKGPPGRADAYRTLTALPAATLNGARLRVVFAPDLKLNELERLLRSIDASISDGPTEAGVFTLTLTGGDNSAAEVSKRLALLRADASVRFAEPVVTAP